MKKLTPRRRNERDGESEVEKDVFEAIPENDCLVVEDDADDECEYDVEDAQEEDLVLVDETASATQLLENHFGDIVNIDVESDDSGDDIWNDDKIPDPLTSDEEEDEERRQSCANLESEEEILALGKKFGCASDFKRALLQYSLKTRYDIKLHMSSQKKLGAICSDTEYDCKWRVYCSYEKRKHKMQIKVYENKHICVRSGYSKMLKSSTIAELFEERLRLNPKFTAKEMALEIKREYNLIVTDEQCRKAKTKLMRERRASHEKHFARIWDYEAEIHKTNKGTIMEIQTIPGPRTGSKQRFDRIYVCFEAQRSAWKSKCRPIIGLDGAFLKWDIKGQLLAAVGRDADNRIVPIAWAVVEIENDVNWDWFVNHLKRDLGLGEGRDYTFISDKQKVI